MSYISRKVWGGRGGEKRASPPRAAKWFIAGESTEMPITQHTGSRSWRLIEWAPFGIALELIFSMMSETVEWLYAAAVLGILASIAVGRTSGKSELPVQARLWKFAKGWLLVVALAGFSLLHGKWQPMVFFAIVGIISSAFFWLGCKSSK
jgi:hypothetical protein